MSRAVVVRRLALAALTLLAGLWLRPVMAQPIDMSQGGPINVTAENGLEWRQDEQEVIATGNARAIRGNVTVTADRLIAHYRRKAAPSAGAAPAGTAPAAATPGSGAGSAGRPGDTPADPAAKPGAATSDAAAKPDAAARAEAAGRPAAAKPDPMGLPGGSDTGSNEIYRLEAVGDVHIDTQTDHATGEHAIYDIDQAVLLMTGNNLKVVTPNDTLTSRDSMEYWTQKHMAVARGDAVIVTNDGRRISADVLVAYTTDNHQPGSRPPAATQVAAKPGAPPQDPLAASGKLQKVEAIGDVVIRTQVDYVSGDRGVYVPDTGIARVAGHVKITRGQNQLNGEEAEVNLKTNVSRLLSSPGGGRVQGLVVPNDSTAQGALPGERGGSGGRDHASGARAGKAAKPADTQGAKP